MRPLTTRIQRLLGEMKRRRVFRAGFAYLVVAWLVVEVAATVFPLLHIPTWMATAVVVVAALGLPVALALAWAYDIEPAGILWGDRDGARAAPVVGSEASGTSPPAAAGEDGGARGRHAVPPSLTPLVGRVEERRELERLLADPGTRLVTIVGPGGMGKTRLALEVGRSAGHLFAHGACFLPLAGMDAGSPLTPTLAEHLGLTLSGREDADAQVSAYLREKSLLLVVDNFEHVTEQAETLSRILTEAPGVKVLATSRERLNLRGETTLPLEGLDCSPAGDEEAAGACDAVDLFLQTARRVDPRGTLTPEDRRIVARICQYVQGLPLAIELAAAWVGVLSCGEIWREIERSHDFLVGSARDLPERHRSLRAVFETSWQLLSEPEREATRRLSVFRGGFAREAAAEVAGASLPVLTGLVEKSILQRQPDGRFEALEILRQYAAERLAADPAELRETAGRHGAYYAGFLHSRRDRLERTADPRAADEVGTEIENVREAWRWMVRECRAEVMAPALDGLFSFYDARGWAREGEVSFGEAAARLGIATPGAGAVADLRHRLLLRQGVFCMQLAEYGKARQLLDAALRHFEGTGEWAERARALDQLGLVATYEGGYDQADQRFRESLAIYREHGSDDGTARSCIYLGMLAFTRGDYPEARRLFGESLEGFRRVGDRRRVATALKNLGGVAFEEGAYQEANALLLESLAIDRELDSPLAIANSLQNLGCVAFRAGDRARAESYLQEGAAISREMGFRRHQLFCLNELGNLLQAEGRLEEAADHYREALAIATAIQQLPVTLDILLGFARVAHDRGEEEQAAKLLCTVLAHPASAKRTRKDAERLAHVLAHPLPSGEAESLERTVAELLQAPVTLSA
jgi:predicted ATPase/Tfp pilus assembly protein PilF